MNARTRAWVVVLTGGLAAGKSAVARRFEALGVNVHDADVAAREVIEPGTAGLAELVEVFGDDALEASGRLDRVAMRQRVFNDPAARQQLEAIIHPRVRQWLRDRAMADPGPYCLLAIPLLARNFDQYRWVDRVLLVDTPEPIRVARVMARDQIDETLARRMIAQQASDAERRALADDVIENHGEEAALDGAVERLHQRYLSMAQAARAEHR